MSTRGAPPPAAAPGRGSGLKAALTAPRRRALRHAFVALAALALCAGLLIASGIVSIAASTGHWPMMEWFLHFAAKRSVAAQARGLQVPASVDDPMQRALGAAHYRLQCEHCHGAPGVTPGLTYQSMTPPPPDLARKVREWDLHELYWIVQHGIKYTAMPAWPTQQRRDEAWAVAAFLVQLPTLDAAQYERLSGKVPPRDGDPLSLALATCSACHGRGGEGRGLSPRLAGQSAAYLAESLHAYADGRRHSGYMEALAGAIDADTRAALAQHFARQAPPPPDVDAQPPPTRADAAHGARIAALGVPQSGVPPCASCHGPAGRGGVNPRYPVLAGQSHDYLVQQLRLFQEDRRGGTSYAPLMQMLSRRLTPEQIDDVAAYFAAQRSP